MDRSTLVPPSARPERHLDPETRAFYCRALTQLKQAGVPFLVGGAYAFERYTGLAQHTKDLDVFVREADCPQALAALETEGCHGEVPFPHWLAKAYCGDHWPVLLSHLILFGYIYPEAQSKIPADVMRTLLARHADGLASAAGGTAAAQPDGDESTDGPICHGTVLSRTQYVVDIDEWGYQDARLAPVGSMTPDEAAHWTAAGLEQARAAQAAG